MTITIPPLSPFPGRGAAPEDYIAQADTTMQQLPGVISGIQAVSDAFNLGTGVLSAGYLPPVPYTAGISMTLALQTVQRGEVTYAPLIERLPFVTGIEFDATAWRVVQGVTSAQLAEADGSEQIGHGAGTIKDKFAAYDARSTALGQFDVILDGSSFLAPGGGNNFADMVGTMPSFVGRGTIYNTAAPGRNMATQWADYPARVRPLIQAAVAAGRKIYVIMDCGPNDYGLISASEIFVNFDKYVSAVKADGGILVPMLPTRRSDWSAFEGTRLSLREHILELGNPLTLATDEVFTDPSFTGPDPQSDDGIHMNKKTAGRFTLMVDSVFASGASFAHVPRPFILRAFMGACVAFTNALGQLMTTSNFSLELSTNATKDLILQLVNSFANAGMTGFRLGTPGEFKSWIMATMGDAGNFSGQLARSLTFFDEFTNFPMMSLSVWQGWSTLYYKWVIRRAGVNSPAEPVASTCAYPAADNSPGYPGQIAYNPAKNKIALYAGDGITSHSWVVAAATTSV